MSAASGLQFRLFLGQQIAEVIDDFAALRIAVFRDWPYLYDGSLSYERDYLASYAKTPSILIGAYAADRLVGASTGLALIDHAAEISTALSHVDIPVEDIFYCAESVVLPDYRGQGAYGPFFQEREDHARACGFTHSLFASVIRPDTHPARPSDDRPLTAIWRARGYKPHPKAIAHLSWRDVGDRVETEKPLQLWMRRL